MEAAIILLILRIRRRRREEAARNTVLSRQASQLNAMAERKTKRQRLSLGGPAVDTSFEDFLTGAIKYDASDEEEEIDQENQDPEDSSEEELSEDDDDEDDPAPIQESKYLLAKVIWHQRTFQSSATKDIYYLLQARLILPDEPVAVTRMLRVPAILLFQDLSDALFAAFDWGGGKTWKYTLEKRAQSSATTTTHSNEFPDKQRTIAELKSLDLSTSTRPSVDIATMDSKHVRLMEIWHHTQAPEIRGLKMFFTYECEGPQIWYTSISFMGVADNNLQAVDLGLNVDEGQQIWCVGGSGACISEWKPDDKIANRHEWDIDFHNAEMSELKVRDESWYT